MEDQSTLIILHLVVLFINVHYKYLPPTLPSKVIVFIEPVALFLGIIYLVTMEDWSTLINLHLVIISEMVHL